MALPILNTQTFELNIPSTDEKIKYRPFLVKEEKILLQAQEGTGDEVTDAILQIVDNCTFGKINVDQLPSFDIEYIFLKIRSKSVGEKVTLNLSFPGDEKVKVPAKVNLMNVEVEVDDNHTNKIQLTDNISVVMAYPTMKVLSKVNMQDLKAQDAVTLIASCIHQIIEGVETLEARDFKTAELNDFVDGMTQSQFAKVNEFFTSMPKLKHEVKLTHPKTKKKGKVIIEGLQSFF